MPRGSVCFCSCATKCANTKYRSHPHQSNKKGNIMATVYIVTRPTENKFGWTPDLTDAARYGTLCVLYEADERPQFHPNKAIKIAREIMQDFSPEDFLLWPGGSDPIGVMIACMVASEFSSEINVLRWERNFNNGERDRSKGFYMPVKLDLS